MDAVKDTLKSSAPGVFFADDGPMSLDRTDLVKSGILWKKSRGRAMLSFLIDSMFSTWQERTVKIHASGKLQYFQDSSLKGEYNLKGCKVTPKSTEETNGHEHAFEINSMDGVLMLAGHNSEEAREWVNVITLVGSGKWKLIEFGNMLGVQLPSFIDVEADESVLNEALVASGYTVDRFNEVFYEAYISNLKDNVQRFVSEDDEFSGLFKERMSSKKIIIRPYPEYTSSTPYYTCSFENGALVIEFKKSNVWTNIGTLGDNIVNILTSGVVPYLTERSIKKYKSARDAHMAQLNSLLQTSGIVYDYCLLENYRAMRTGNYTDDRFGEIFFDTYLKELVSKIKSFVESDSGFIEIFNNRLTAKKIIIRPGTDTSGFGYKYNKSKFTNDGELLLEYRSVWTNLGEFGSDIVEAVTAGGGASSVPYLTQKSIRDHQDKLNENIAWINTLLQVSDFSYDYCLKENYEAMHKANYGDDRFGEIFFETHLKAFIERLQSLIDADAGFLEVLKGRWTTHKLVIKPAKSISEYWNAKFVDGDLLIEYKSFWTNLSQLGHDLVEAVSEGSGSLVPYLTQKSMRENQDKLDLNIALINDLLQTSDFSYDYCLKENYDSMKKASYGDDRFGEIFFETHLKAFIERLQSLIDADAGFLEVLKGRWTTHKLVIKPAKSISEYWNAKFVDGDLLIEYKSFWTNLSQLGHDLVEAVSEGSGSLVPYLTQKSMRENQDKLDLNIALINDLLQTSDFSYDYCLKENYDSMKKASYGDDRFGEIFFETHLKAFIERLQSLIDADAGFLEVLKGRWTTHKLVIKPAKSISEYWNAKFVDGDLLIEYKSFWTNLSQLGHDLVEAVSEGSGSLVPYLTQKSMRENQDKLDENISTINEMLGVSNFTYDYALEDNYKSMRKANYGDDRFGEIFFETHLKAFIERLQSLIDDDEGFLDALFGRWETKKLIIKPAANERKMGSEYWNAKFVDGDLLIEYKSFWTNLSQLGQDIPDAITEGTTAEVPYLTQKSMRKNQEKLNENLEILNELLQTTGITYDFCLKENYAAMRKANYEAERFGEIFFDTHLSALIDRLKRCIESDEGFLEAFMSRWTTKNVIIKPTANASKMGSEYWNSKFLPNGDLLIEYKSFWTNLYDLGKDFVEAISEGSGSVVPYLTQKSIRDHQTDLNDNMEIINEILETSGVTYDYCLKENYDAMHKAQYGDDRFGEIFFDVHLKALIEKLREFKDADSGFLDLFKIHFKTQKIVIKPTSNGAKMGSNYYKSSFNGEGDLIIEYKAFWTNVYELGKDLTEAISVGRDIPYLTEKSIRLNQEQLNNNLEYLNEILETSGVTYDYCLNENYEAMHKANYDDERFGEIFFSSHLTPLIEKLREFKDADSGFLSFFMSRFTGKTIIIKPASNPAKLDCYYKSSFTSDGNLLIEYKAFWTNIYELGKDIVEAMSA